MKVNPPVPRRWRRVEAYLIYCIDKDPGTVFREAPDHLDPIAIREDGRDQRDASFYGGGIFDQALPEWRIWVGQKGWECRVVNESGAHIYLACFLSHFDIPAPAGPRVQLQGGSKVSISRGSDGHWEHTVHCCICVFHRFLRGNMLILACLKQWGPQTPGGCFVQVRLERVVEFILGLQVMT